MQIIFVSVRFTDEEHRPGKIMLPDKTCQNEANKNPLHVDLQTGRLFLKIKQMFSNKTHYKVLPYPL